MKGIRSRLLVTLTALVLLLPVIPLPSASAAILNVTAYGANGGDTSDDTDAIQSAIDASAAGDTVYFPNGTYYLSSSSGGLEGKSGVKLLGQSRDGAILKYTSNTDAYMLNLNNTSNTEVSYLTFWGNNHTIIGIFAENTNGLSGNHKFHHLNIKELTMTSGFGPFGIMVSHSNDNEISDSEFHNMGVGSIWGAGVRAGWNSSRTKVLRNVVDGSGRGGIFLNDFCEDVVVAGNTVTNSGLAEHGLSIELHTDCNRAIVEDNHVDHWLSVVRSAYVAVRRNVVHTTDNSVQGMGLEVMVNHAITTDNLVDGGQQVGMQQSPGTGYQYWGYNTVKNMVMWGMQLQGEGTGEMEQFQYFYKNKFQDGPANDPRAAYSGYGGNAIRIHGNSQNLTFDSNEITNNGRKGIEITGASGVDRLSFINNIITGNAGPSIDQYPASAANLEWSNNTVSGNGVDTQLTSRGFSDPKPVANFTGPTNISLGQSVTFTNTSTDNGTIVENLWDLGEGIPLTTVSPTYTYQKAGTYRVTLVVWDNGGRAHIKEQTVIVTAGPPDTQAPTAPTNLNSSTKTDTTVNLSWTASTDNVGVASYDVYRGGTFVGNSPTTSYMAMGLTANTAYSFTVKAKDAVGNLSAASNTLNITTLPIDTQAPTAPSGLASPSKTDTSVSLSWNAATDNFGVTGYEVYKDGTLNGSTSTTGYTVSGLTPNTAYTFTVKAKDAAGNLSAASVPLSVTTSPLILGTIVREYWSNSPGSNIVDHNFNATPTGTQVLTSLKGPSNWGDNYADRIRGFIIPSVSGSYTFSIAGDNNSQLWLSPNSNPASRTQIGYVNEYTGENDWNANAWQTSGAISLVAGQKYYVEVLHKEAAGGDHVSVGWTGPGISTRVVVPGANLAPYYEGGSGDVQAPTAPANLTSPSKTATSVSLSWTASTDNVGVTGYDVYKNGVLDGSSNGTTTYMAAGLTANTAYTFTVKAKDAASNVSGASNALSVTTSSSADTQAPTAPTNLTSPSKTATSVSLSWTASTDNVDVTGYDVFQNGVQTGSTTGSTVYTISGLTASTSYDFTVKAKDAAGNLSNVSNTLNVVTSSTGGPTPTGSITREYWTGIAGDTVASIPTSTTPTGTLILTSFKAPTNFGDNYGTRIRGYIVPTVSGSYTFSIAGDNNSELYLSTDSNPANKSVISYVTDWVGEEDWSARTSQVSATINLVAGQRYYVEVLHKEAVGGDHVAVGWTGPGITTRVVIPGANLAPFE